MEVRQIDLPGSETQATLISMSDRLARILQDRIERGELAIGNSLPSERELMIEHQVSRTTVREALRILSAQGLIKVKRGRGGGSFISSPSSSSMVRSLNLFINGQGIRFIDLVYAREAIEPAAAAQAATRRTVDQLENLRLGCISCERTFHDRQLHVEANLAWHLSLAQASNNPLFVAFLTSIWSALHAATDFEEFDLTTRKAVVGVHWQIYDAVRVGDPGAAHRRMARHLSAYSERLSAIDLPGDEIGPISPDAALQALVPSAATAASPRRRSRSPRQ